jgi:membrane protein YqaA with SNARE-associated domain
LQGHLSGWKQKVIGFATSLGAPGLFLISFLDSSVLSFPVINDLLLISLSIQRPSRMILYATMATTGSVLGCIFLYFLARKAGEAAFHEKAGKRGAKIRHFIEENGFVGMLIAALLPPPTPFKFFVLAAGVFRVPLWSFSAAVTLARVVRYFAVGYLVVHYGSQALPYLATHKLIVVGALAALVGVSYGASRFIMYEKHELEKKH